MGDDPRHVSLLTAEADVDRGQFAVNKKPFTSCCAERRANLSETLQHLVIGVRKCLSAPHTRFEVEGIAFWNSRKTLSIANGDEIGAGHRSIGEIELAVEFI